MRHCHLFACIVLLLLFAIGLQGQEQKQKVKLPEADELIIRSENGEYDLNGDVIHLKKGHNQVVYGPIELNAQEMWFNQQTSEFKASGDVVVKLDDGTSWASQNVNGNLNAKELNFDAYGFDGKVWHSGGEGGHALPNGEKHLDHAWLTTCDCYPPHYRVCASDMTHYPDNTFSAKHLIIKLGVVPVFYFPYAWGTTDNSAGLIFKPGYSGKKGAYLRLGRIWQLQGDDNYTQFYTDLMSKRGVALGHDTEWKSDRQQVSVNLYGLLDRDPPETERGYNRRFDEEHDRFRIATYYRYDVSETSAIRLNVDYMSDIDMLEDWFKHDYRQILQTKSYLNWTTDGDFYNFTVNVRPRINEFYTVVETLPEVRLDIPRISLGELPLEYQSSTSFGYYSMKWRNFYRHRWEVITDDEYDSEVHRDPADYQAFRADTVHFMYLPMALDDYVKFIPRAGFRATYYSKTSKARIRREDIAAMIDVDNPDHVYNSTPIRQYDNDGGDVLRTAFEIGGELKNRMYSDWVDMNLDFIDGHGIRHVVEPYVNYTYAHDPSHDCDHLYFFDEIDRLERQHFIRLGVDQLWQTRIDGRVNTIARWQNYVDFHFDRGEESGRHPGDYGSRLDIYPCEWLTFWSAILHDIGEGDIQCGETGFRYGKIHDFNLSCRYVYRNDHMSRSVYSMGSTLVDLTGESSYYKKYFETADTINVTFHVPLLDDEKMSFDVEAEYDFEKNTLSEHKYIINKDLHCWTMSFGVGWDNGDFEAMILFRLKAFPNVKVDLNI
ncbi:MAG: LPS-assembly protein LptD [Victivallales bacterium]|nr:LPS-assembly protein LptD [Victivallales bacterium]